MLKRSLVFCGSIAFAVALTGCSRPEGPAAGNPASSHLPVSEVPFILDQDAYGVLVWNAVDGSIAGYETGVTEPDWTVLATPDVVLQAVCQKECPDAGVFPVATDQPSRISSVTWVTDGRKSQGPLGHVGGYLQLLSATNANEYVLAEHMPGAEATTIKSVQPTSVLHTSVAGGPGRYFESPSGEYALVRTADTDTTGGSIVWTRPAFNSKPQPVQPQGGSGPASLCLDDHGAGLLLNDTNIQTLTFPDVTGEKTIQELESGMSQCVLLQEGRLVIGSIFSDDSGLHSHFEDTAPGRDAFIYNVANFASVSSTSDGSLTCLSGVGGSTCWKPDGSIAFENDATVNARPLDAHTLVYLDEAGRPIWLKLSE